MKSDALSLQAESPDSRQTSEMSIVSVIPVGAISDNRVRDAVQMAADLVKASGEGFQFKQAVTAGKAGVEGLGEFHLAEAAIAGDRLHHLSGRIRGQRAINHAITRRPSSDDGVVGLLNSPFLKLASKEGRRLGR